MLLQTTKYYSLLTIRKYYSVLECNTLFYKVVVRTTRYGTVLLHNTTLLQILHSTAEENSALQETTPYYKIYSVLQSTIPFDSRNTWNVIYIAQCNLGGLWGAKHNENYNIHVWKAQHMNRHLHCTEQSLGCKTQCNYDIHVW